MPAFTFAKLLLQLAIKLQSIPNNMATLIPILLFPAVELDSIENPVDP